MYHLSIIHSYFKCPICTCYQQVADSPELCYTMKCKGCKRKLNVSPHGFSHYHVSNSADEKEFVITNDYA